jgi:hypothetical protein
MITFTSGYGYEFTPGPKHELVQKVATKDLTRMALPVVRLGFAAIRPARRSARCRWSPTLLQHTLDRNTAHLRHE